MKWTGDMRLREERTSAAPRAHVVDGPAIRPDTLASLREQLSRDRAERVRAHIDAEARMAARRRQLAEMGELFDPANDPGLSLAERMASALVETPGDVIAAVKRQWPELWAQVMAEGRGRGVMPGVALMDVIARGLAAGKGCR